MSDDDKGGLPFGLNRTHVISGVLATGLASGGSYGLMHYQIGDLEKRMDRTEQNQTQIIRNQDATQNNAARILSLEKQLSYLLRHIPPTPTDPH